MPNFSEEAARSAGQPPIKKLKQIDPYDYAQSLPAGGMTIDMLRKTRPPPRKQVQSQPPPSEAWATPRKGNNKNNMKVLTLKNDTLKHDDKWAEHRQNNGKIDRINKSEMSLSLRSVDSKSGRYEEKINNNQTLINQTLTPKKTLYQTSNDYGDDNYDDYSRDDEDFMNDDGSSVAVNKSVTSTKNNENYQKKQKSVVLSTNKQSSSNNENTLPKLSLPLSAEEKRNNIPKGTIFERESPRAKATLKSFLRNFMEENG